ncbi:MAG: MFS transporter [Micromonosporaceae bacterium]
MRDVLRRPDFRLLFAGLVASMTGESILLLALAIWVKDLTGSDGMAGATIFAVVAPMTLAPLIGWVVDRFRRRTFLIVANLVSAVALTPLFAVDGRDQVWIIYAVAVAYGLSYIAVSAALQGLIKVLLPEELLAEANGALQTVRQGLRLAGPLLGAALYTAIGGTALAVVGAAGFVLAAGVIAMLRVSEARPERGEQRWLVEAVAGARHLVREAALRRTVFGLALALLVVGFTESIIFAYVDQGLHRPPAFVGVIVTVEGIGGLLGGLVAARFVRRLGEVGTAALGILLFGVGFAGLIYPHLAVGFPAVVVAGFGLPLVIVAFNTIMQRRAPSELMGRVAAAADALINAPYSLSIGVGAVLVSIMDYRVLFAVMAASMTVVAIWLWAGRSLSSPVPPAADAEAPSADAKPPATPTAEPTPVP